MRRAISKLALAVMLAGFVSHGAQAQPAGTPLSAVVISVTVSIWPAIVADKKGYFKEEGLDFDFINSGASTRSVQQVAAGSAPIGSSSMVDTLRAIDKGAKVKVFLNSLAVGTHSLIGAKAIKQVGAGAQGQARDDRRSRRHHQPVVDRHGAPLRARAA